MYHALGIPEVHFLARNDGWRYITELTEEGADRQFLSAIVLNLEFIVSMVIYRSMLIYSTIAYGVV